MDRFLAEFSRAALAVVLVLGVLALGMGVLLFICPELVLRIACRILAAVLLCGGAYTLVCAVWSGRRNETRNRNS